MRKNDCHQCHKQLPTGHVGPRYCSVACGDRRRAQNRERSKRWEAAHPGRSQEHNRRWKIANVEKIRERARIIRERDRERFRANSRRHYQRHLATERLRSRTRNRLAYQADPEAGRERARAWRQKNPEKVRDLSAKFRRANPDKRANTEQRRRARKRNASGSFTFEEWRTLCERHGPLCFYCGHKRKLTADHVAPLSRGGAHVVENIVPACKSCNSSKGNKDPLTWLEWRIGRGEPMADTARGMLSALRNAKALAMIPDSVLVQSGGR
jgi:5-methylcytosine-specific restriction endonuclease McrA